VPEIDCSLRFDVATHWPSSAQAFLSGLDTAVGVKSSSTWPLPSSRFDPKSTPRQSFEIIVIRYTVPNIWDSISAPLSRTSYKPSSARMGRDQMPCYCDCARCLSSIFFP
jgi:hypothetical protein